MLEDVKQFTDFLCKWKITPNQFYLCWLLYWDHRDGHGGIRRLPKDPSACENLYRYASTVTGWRAKEVERLKKIGFIRMPDISREFFGRDQIDHMEITQKFVKALVATATKFDELLEAYPTWIDNFNNPAKGQINLKVGNIEALEKTYLSYVKTQKRHRQVMEILEWAKANDKIKMSFENFIRSKAWNHLEELMEKEGADVDDGKFGNRMAF